MSRSMYTQRLAAIAVATGLTAVSSVAFASGFASARFGGIYGHPLGTTAAAVYYNPGAVAFQPGTQILVDYTAAIRSATYNRPESATTNGGLGAGSNTAVGLEANTGEASLFNLISAPMLGFSTDFGGNSPVHLFGGFYVPFGGQAVWDKVDAPDEAPWADDGPQRWFTIDGSIKTMVGTLGVSRLSPDGRFGFGIAGNLMISSVNTVRARNPDGSERVVSDGGFSQEGRAWLDASSIDIGIGAGFMWEAVEDRVTIAGSWQSAPNISGNMELEGDLHVVLPGGSTGSTSDIVFTQTIPQTFRLGASYRFTEEGVDGTVDPVGEIRLSADVTTWNQFEDQCVLTASIFEDDDVSGADACQLDADGTPSDDSGSPTSITQSFLRNWELGWGVKLGGSYWLGSKYELAASVSYDANAIPDESLDPVLMDMDKLVVDVGASLPVTPWLDVNLLVGNVFYFERENTNSSLAELLPNSRQPNANGTYSQNILLLNAGLNFKF